MRCDQKSIIAPLVKSVITSVSRSTPNPHLTVTLYLPFYPNQKATVREIMANEIRQRVLILCGDGQ